jgi:hypothetical protein
MHAPRHLVRAMPRDRVGHLWVLHAKSVPRNGLWERRGLECDADEPRLPSRAIDCEEAAVQLTEEKTHMTTRRVGRALIALAWAHAEGPCPPRPIAAALGLRPSPSHLCGVTGTDYRPRYY